MEASLKATAIPVKIKQKAIYEKKKKNELEIRTEPVRLEAVNKKKTKK